MMKFYRRLKILLKASRNKSYQNLKVLLKPQDFTKSLEGQVLLKPQGFTKSLEGQVSPKPIDFTKSLKGQVLPKPQGFTKSLEGRVLPKVSRNKFYQSLITIQHRTKVPPQCRVLRKDVAVPIFLIPGLSPESLANSGLIPESMSFIFKESFLKSKFFARFLKIFWGPC